MNKLDKENLFLALKWGYKGHEKGKTLKELEKELEELFIKGGFS